MREGTFFVRSVALDVVEIVEIVKVMNRRVLKSCLSSENDINENHK